MSASKRTKNKKKDAERVNPELCQHQPDWGTVAFSYEIGDERDGVVDVTCLLCGYSGSVLIHNKDINWN